MAIKALVVDNNPVLLRAISAILEKEGCDVLSAPNGLEALNLLKGFTPDIIFTDLIMPHIGGEQLCRIIRNNSELKHVYLVVISGIVLEDFDNILSEKYYDLCIAKGNLSELRKHIHDALQRFDTMQGEGERTPGYRLARIPDGLMPSSLTTELLFEKRHLNNILENLDEGIVEVNLSGLVVSVNPAAMSILGVREEEIVGSLFADYPWKEHQQRVSLWFSQQLAGFQLEPLNILEDDPISIEGRIVTASFIPVRDEKTVFGLCILRNITRQYTAEEHERELNNAIKLVAKMEAMSYMAGGIAHDFNNLLTVVCGNLDILTHTATKETDPDRIKLLKHARSAAYMAVDLTRKISKSSPFGIVSRQKHVLEEIVADTVNRFQQEQKREILIVCSEEKSLVNINPDQIAAALGNILQNSIEADGRGPISVTIEGVLFESPSIIAGQYVPAGNYSAITVKDCGQGIEPENLLKIFDPYFSTKARGVSKGMGLGLTVVYATLRNHGGYVVVESTLGAGTSVSCYLPCYGHIADEQPRLSKTGKASNGHILLIENDTQIQEVGKIMLEYLGYVVTVAASLEAAVVQIKENVADDEGQNDRIEVAIIDPSQTPVQDPQEIYACLKNIDRNMRIIITGASTLDPVMSDCESFGYNSALPKPFTLENLKHTLLTVMA